MKTIYQQLAEERRAHYDNGLYHCFQAYYLYSLKSIVVFPCEDIQIDLLISDGVFYNPDHVPVPAKKLLLLFVNTFVPGWILDSYDKKLTEEYFLDLHKRISYLPLRDSLKPERWAGKYKSKDISNDSQALFQIPRDDFYEWVSAFVPLYFRISPFKQLNELVLYALIIKETLYHDLFFPRLQKEDFEYLRGERCNIKEFFQLRIAEEKEEFDGFIFD